MFKTSFQWKGMVFLAVSVLLLSACGTQTAQEGSGAPIPETAGEFDELFINMMVPHHEGALEMARIAQERSTRPEVLEMANAILSSQAGEIDQMRAWKQDWYGSSDTPPMSDMPSVSEMSGMGAAGHGMDMQAEVDALRSAPEPFDLAFIDSMIAHHQSAIEAAQLGLQQAARPEIKALAEQIVADQQREVDQLMQWRTDWFPDAPAPSAGGH